MTEQYTTEYQPTRVSPPGATLADILEERGITQADFAIRTGRPTKTINEIIKGKAGITADTAIQFEKALGNPAAFWLAREARYREWLARNEDRDRLHEAVSWLGELPLKSMKAFKWVRAHQDKVSQVGECLSFFGVASVKAYRERYEQNDARFRTSTRVSAKPGAVAAWLRAGELAGEAAQLPAFDEKGFRDALEALRAVSGESDLAKLQATLRERCAEHGVALVFIPGVPGCPASGATRWLTPTKPLLQLSLRYRSNDQIWFTFFHEAGHILLHGKRDVFLEFDGQHSAKEDEADTFARDALIPAKLAPQLHSLKRSEQAVMAFARQAGIAPGIVVGRMQKEGLLPWTHLNGLKVRFASEHPASDEA